MTSWSPKSCSEKILYFVGMSLFFLSIVGEPLKDCRGHKKEQRLLTVCCGLEMLVRTGVAALAEMGGEKEWTGLRAGWKWRRGKVSCDLHFYPD